MSFFLEWYDSNLVHRLNTIHKYNLNKNKNKIKGKQIKKYHNEKAFSFNNDKTWQAWEFNLI